jgi:predicted transcriptional regulator
MSAKINDTATKRQNKYNVRNYMVKLIAEDCGCTARQVRNILSGISGNRKVTALSQNVTVAYAMRMDAEGQLKEKLKRKLNRG